jgi:hypothetical protein
MATSAVTLSLSDIVMGAAAPPKEVMTTLASVAHMRARSSSPTPRNGVSPARFAPGSF